MTPTRPQNGDVSTPPKIPNNIKKLINTEKKKSKKDKKK